MGVSGFGGMGFMESFFFGGGFQILFFLMFALVLGMILFTLIRGIAQWNKNNHSPRLTVGASVVGKRMDVSRHHHHGSDNFHHTSTSTPITSPFRWKAATGWS